MAERPPGPTRAHPTHDPWRETLRAARRRIGVSQIRLAELADLSPETVRAYEGGRRMPRREHLLALLRALDAPLDVANDILEGAGFAPAKTLFPPDEFPEYFFTVDELQAEVERVPWIEFVLNEPIEVVAANTAAQAVWNVDFHHEHRIRTAAQMNLLSVASDRKFADRVTNWDECVATMIAVAKGRPERPHSMEAPNTYFEDVLKEFASRNGAFLERLIQLWATTPAREAKVRWDYRVVWNDPELGEMRLMSLVSMASAPDALAFNDWIPVDADSWRVLELVKSRWLAAR